MDRPGDLNKRMRTATIPKPATEDIELIQFTEMELNFQMGGMYQLTATSSDVSRM
jgi:hypothetical protein